MPGFVIFPALGSGEPQPRPAEARNLPTASGSLRWLLLAAEDAK